MAETTNLVNWRELHAAVVDEENGIGFPSFGHAQAWELGTSMVAVATQRGYPIAIGITFGEQRVFHAALTGATATNDDWLARKIRAVAKHNCSSWALTCLYRADGTDYFTEGGYSRSEIALSGGAVPLRVQGSLIGAVGVSGLPEEDDHRFVIESLRALQA